MNESTRLFAGWATKFRNPLNVSGLAPPWSTTVVTPDRMPTRSAFRPKMPVTCS